MTTSPTLVMGYGKFLSLQANCYHDSVKSDIEILEMFSEVDKCQPNPCHNNATCINDLTRVKCICPNATESETAIVGLTCNESMISYHFHIHYSTVYKPRKCKYNRNY